MNQSLEDAVLELQQWRAQLDAHGISSFVTTSAWLPMNTVAVTAAYTMSGRDKIVLANATGAPFTVTLPNAATRKNQQPLTVKRINGGGNAVTVASAGGTIDGAATQTLATQYASLDFVSDGTNWYIK